MRKPRELLEGVTYHVVARANRKEFIMDSVGVKQMFLDVVERARRRFDFSVTHFCIMSNHVHLMIRPCGNENLSRIMQWILSVFAVSFNRLFGYRGHVWYDRFKSRIISSLMQWIATFLYITENPARAGMVARPEEYRFNGINCMRRGDYAVIDPPAPLVKLLFPATDVRALR